MGYRLKPRKLYLEKLFSSYQPRKLYCCLRVEFNQITLHIWQGGRKLIPAKYEYSFNEFHSNRFMLDLIEVQLGSVWLKQMLSLITGHGTSLLEMPEQFLKDLAQHLAMTDLINLTSTCKYFNKIYSSDDIWKPFFDQFFKSICTLASCDQTIKENGYKFLCRKICIDNQEKSNNKDICKTECSMILGKVQEQKLLRLKTSRFDKSCDDLPNESQSTPLLGSCSSNQLPTVALKSEPTIHLNCKSSSKICAGLKNADSFVSRGSDREDFQDCITDNCGPPVVKSASDNSGNQENVEGFHFTKADLMRRLEYLKTKTKKFECSENFLPGDQTKYALKYRDELRILDTNVL